MTAEVLGDVVPMYPEADTATDQQSWDAFWAEQEPPQTTTIRGVTVRVPTGMTLRAQRRISERRERKPGDMESSWAPVLVDLLRDPDGARIDDLWDRWDRAGMEMDELSAVVVWAMSNAQGAPITFAEARRRALAGPARDDEGKGAPEQPPTETS